MMVKACGRFSVTLSVSVKLLKDKHLGRSTDLFELLDPGLFEHGEHVGAGSVRSLLRLLGCLRAFL